MNAEETCKVCKELHSPLYPDPCLGYIPGVFAACCGHGDKVGYIWLRNGTYLYIDSLKFQTPLTPSLYTLDGSHKDYV